MTITDELKKVQEALGLIDEAADLLHYHGAFRYEGGKPQPFNREAEVAAELKALLPTIIAQVEALEAAHAWHRESIRCMSVFLADCAVTMGTPDGDAEALGDAIEAMKEENGRLQLRPTPDLDSPELREVVASTLRVKIWIDDECGFDGDGERLAILKGIDEAAKAALSAIKAHLEGKG